MKFNKVIHIIHHISYLLTHIDVTGKNFCNNSNIEPDDHYHPFMCSTYEIKQLNQTNCSEWSLYVLNELNKGMEFTDVLGMTLNCIHTE